MDRLVLIITRTVAINITNQCNLISIFLATSVRQDRRFNSWKFISFITERKRGGLQTFMVEKVLSLSMKNRGICWLACSALIIESLMAMASFGCIFRTHLVFCYWKLLSWPLYHFLIIFGWSPSMFIQGHARSPIQRQKEVRTRSRRSLLARLFDIPNGPLMTLIDVKIGNEKMSKGWGKGLVRHPTRRELGINFTYVKSGAT